MLDFVDASTVVDSSYEFSVVDANSLAFTFNNAPEVAKFLRSNSELSYEQKYHSDRSSWVVSERYSLFNILQLA